MSQLKFILIFLSLIILFSVSSTYAEEFPIINAIEIQGLKRIEESAIKSKIVQKRGETISQEKTNEDIKAIFKMGYFDDVRAEIEPFEGGVKLIYIVKEKPTIIKIDLQGNDEIEDSKLREKLTITTGAIADAVLIQDNANNLRMLYEEEGYWLSHIVPVIRRIGEDEVSLTYQIEEGQKIRIKKIIFEGNKAISSGKIKKVMETKEWWLFSFITSSGYYQKVRIDSDIEKIKDLYFNNGFIKVVVGEPTIKLTEDKEGMIISIPISEGEQFKISSIELSGNKVFDENKIREKITMSKGELFSKEKLRKDIFSISDLYSQNGYAAISVTPDLSPDQDNKLVSVSLKIDEGEQYKIGRIEISGNTKTRDKVIRREVKLDEGDIYNSALIKRSYERINNLNFFETVELIPKPRPEEKLVDIEIKVKERATGFFSIGGGYSSVENFIFMAELTQGNLFGKGQFIKLRGELGGRTTLYDISYKDPWFLDKPLTFSTSLYKTTREYIEYNKKATGFEIAFGKRFTEYVWGNIAYNFEDAEIYDVTDDAPTIIKDQEGTSVTSSITPSLVRDSRDNFLDPSRGSRNSLSVTFAGLGGTNKFLKGELDSAWFIPIKSTSVMLRGRFGYATGIGGEELPLYERFYVGGIYTVRGLDYGEAGPRDEETGDEIGGTEQLIFNVEYIFPLISDIRLKGLIFFDAGNSYEEFNNFGELRYTTGLGVRWISPIGPVRIEWGYNLDRKPGESSSRFEFAFGTFF
ncbi:MAG: outer membrane protein assembly factor BamA [Nitrospirae bacterium]|nr:outer membrane protein assembly factor BamA [Nitrospirota bacterium]